MIVLIVMVSGKFSVVIVCVVIRLVFIVLGLFKMFGNKVMLRLLMKMNIEFVKMLGVVSGRIIFIKWC